jgi:hypothetical protein
MGAAILAFGPPPREALLRIGERLEDALCRCPDGDFLDDGVALAGGIHRSSSM